MTRLLRDDAQWMIKTNEQNLDAKDMPSIMAGYTDDVISYASSLDIRGKEKLEQFLRAQVVRMADYKLPETLDVTDGNTIVSSTPIVNS